MPPNIVVHSMLCSLGLDLRGLAGLGNKHFLAGFGPEAVPIISSTFALSGLAILR
jgi:hypothetical protein